MQNEHGSLLPRLMISRYDITAIYSTNRVFVNERNVKGPPCVTTDIVKKRVNHHLVIFIAIISVASLAAAFRGLSKISGKLLVNLSKIIIRCERSKGACTSSFPSSNKFKELIRFDFCVYSMSLQFLNSFLLNFLKCVKFL